MTIGEHLESPARSAVVRLLKAEREWRRHFRTCCETSTSRLWKSAYDYRTELQMRGEWHDREEIGDVLLSLAREKLPYSPTARWDAKWASKLCRESLERLSGHYAGLSEADRDRLNLEAEDEFLDRMKAAGEENDPAAFRRALAGWERASLEAFESARSRRPVVS